MATPAPQPEIEALCAAAGWCGARGWLPATSGNFSVRAPESGHIFISPTGVDKAFLQPAQLLELDADGQLLRGDGKSSAETVLHTILYRERPAANAILHVHTIWNTLLSAQCLQMGVADGAAAGAVDRPESGAVLLEGYELLKALEGVDTHAHREAVPVLANSQDYAALGLALTAALRQHPAAHGVLLSAHGLYTWGRSVADARRHLEALEFLFEVEARRRGRGGDAWR